MIKKIITRFMCIVIARCRCVVAPAEKRALTTLTVRFYSSSDTFSIFEEEKEMLIGLISYNRESLNFSRHKFARPISFV